MWERRDEFHFAWKRLKGDFILQARVKLIGKGVEEHRKLGLMVRSSLEADSPYADAAAHGDGLTSLQYRRTRGAETEEVQSPVSGPDFLQLERRKDTYILSVARFGEPLTVSQVADLALGDEVYAGLFLCSHNADVIESGVFQDVRVIRPAKEGFVPYRTTSAAGSRSSTSRAADDNWSTVRRSPSRRRTGPPTARRLIFNSSGSSDATRGRLHRFDLATRKRHGDRHRHRDPQQQRPRAVLRRQRSSRISDQSQGDESAVYTCRRRAARRSGSRRTMPSYLHGWSPGRQAPRVRRRTQRRVRHLPHGQRRQRRRRYGSPRRRGSTTGRSTARTGSTSTSTPCAAA